jgi:hypothetical protein
MVNHICEPISSNQFASCSSARVGQGGGGAPLTNQRAQHGLVLIGGIWLRATASEWAVAGVVSEFTLGLKGGSRIPRLDPRAPRDPNRSTAERGAILADSMSPLEVAQSLRDTMSMEINIVA